MLKITTNQKPNFPELEEKVLEYWDRVRAFEKSVEQRPEDKPYVFYDGPPFATGLPHYGHLLGSIMKDIIPRYWTMKGYRVERVWGWDCHGLPIENIVEKELKLRGGKKGIEEMGIDKFNNACREAIWRFDKEWEKVINRIGRWVNFKNSYKTMDTNFMESVWWAFKTLYDKKLVYQGHKVILYCPRCATPLSNFEIAMDNSYKELESPSTIYKYKLKDQENTYLLAWSTTPWNKLATPALAVNPNLTYTKIEQNGESYILAENTLEKMLVNKSEYKVVDSVKGTDLEGIEFELHYDFYPRRNDKQAGVVVADDYVTDEEGTGVVTLAVYGEDDYRVMQRENIQLVEHVDEQGMLKPEVKPWAGMFILKVNPLVNQDLKQRNLIYHDQPIVHNVPVCYRCDTRLYHAPIPAWFIDVQSIKPSLVKHNDAINWYPPHLKHGRFGKGLETAPDWNISRSRYWGTPIPVWRDESSGKIRVIGSISELKDWAVNPDETKELSDIHREYIDHIEVWVDDAKTIKGIRVPEVFDCWVESGSMPFASEHYPFENKDRFKNRHPAQFISEYIAQTRAWFYTLHVMSVALFDQHTFENALTTGTIMAHDGTKMSKSKRNFTDPMVLVDKFGVDSLRLYFASSPIMKTAENVNFSEDSVDEIRKKVFNIFWNVFAFYKLYDDGSNNFDLPDEPKHVLDKWLLSKTEKLALEVINSMDKYDVVSSSRSLMEFVNEFSTWWLRLSRDRLRDEDNNSEALTVFRFVLKRWCLLMAPFAPFFTEMVYQNLMDDKLESVHLELCPEGNEDRVDDDLEDKMDLAKKIVEGLHSLRKKHQVNLRQPLGDWSFDCREQNVFVGTGIIEVIEQETNVKNYLVNENSEDLSKRKTADFTSVTTRKYKEVQVYLDFEITPELKAEGEAREIIRSIQQARKKAGTELDELVTVKLPGWPKDFEQEIKSKVNAKALIKSQKLTIVRD